MGRAKFLAAHDNTEEGENEIKRSSSVSEQNLEETEGTQDSLFN